MFTSLCIYNKLCTFSIKATITIYPVVLAFIGLPGSNKSEPLKSEISKINADINLVSLIYNDFL